MAIATNAPYSSSVQPTDVNHDIITLDVMGMKCAGCVRAVETQLNQIPGIIQATVNLITEVATVEVNQAIDPQIIAQHLTDAGFPSQPRQAAGFQAQLKTGLDNLEILRFQQSQRQRRDLIIAIGLLIASSTGHLSQMLGWSIPALTNDWLHGALAAATLSIPGRAILVEGWQGLRRNAPNMNTLIGLGAVTAFVTSVVALLFPQLHWECFFSEPVMLIGFILLGRTLEGRARNRAASALQALAALQPKTASVVGKDKPQLNVNDINHDSAIKLPLDLVQVGDWVQVLPGEQVPVDGQILQGTSTINESMLTGESVPVTKQVGDDISGGTMNQSGAIIMRVSSVGQDTTLARIIKLVEDAQGRKAPIQQLADTIAGYFTYGVLTIASITFLFWFFIGSHLWPDVAIIAHPMAHHAMGGIHREAMPSITATPMLLSIKLTIAVLVVACPCALGLATPTALLVGSGIGAERGLLIRGGDVLEKAHKLTTLVFDKTGTLTKGEPEVTEILPQTAAINTDQLLQIAATIESGTQHPLASAIMAAAQARSLPLLPATDFQTIAGSGVSATVTWAAQNQLFQLGTLTWLESQSIAIAQSVEQQARELAGTGKTVVGISLAEQFVGLIAIHDRPRPEAATVIHQLQNQGIQVMMLTGDRLDTAHSIAQTLGIPPQQVLAEVKPAAKAQAIAQLQTTNSSSPTTVGMVGDGINDAPALAQADVGIALQAGTEVATETADILLMRNSLSDVAAVLQLSQSTFSKIRQNLFWAFVYNVIAVPAAAGVLLPAYHITLSPSNAGLLMALSSISVVTNSLLLRWKWR
ncbi:copper-translocating P-type ATPase [filamentous cyanobacterium LEGE 11480]|uniref:Copper-translocating P-type ATPase n=1 Tax=Romeriopsis navalis LEGE 11480 TaxID=2777977 RepID=A0A928Z2G2_9CYAN|nr:heavy metal translocating P-type ATPase [Romeriopsis navalis]MBE9029509.1 copper-translocating P-type ATPase [Romeriopsis navalis LEGE 11480]